VVGDEVDHAGPKVVRRIHRLAEQLGVTRSECVPGRDRMCEQLPHRGTHDLIAGVETSPKVAVHHLARLRPSVTMSDEETKAGARFKHCCAGAVLAGGRFDTSVAGSIEAHQDRLSVHLNQTILHSRCDPQPLRFDVQRH